MAAGPLRITQPVQATKFDLDPARTYLTPWLAVDPDDNMKVAGAFIESRSKRCGFMRSTDGGTTWTKLDSSPSPPSYPFCLMTNSHTFQGKVEWGRGDRLYYALDGWDTNDAPRRSVFLARSDDFGDTWNTTTVADARGTEGPDQHDNRPLSGFAVDRKTGGQDTVYLGWRRQFPGQSSPNAKANAAMVAVSTDGGRTFAEPVDLSLAVFNDQAERQEALTTATTVAAPPTTTTTTPGVTEPGPAAGSPTGAQTPATTTTTVPPNSRAANKTDVNNFGGSNPVVAIDDKGTAYVAWVTRYANLTPSPSSAHFLSKSTDRGRTWTTTQITPYDRENVNNFGGYMLRWSPKGGTDGSLHLVYEGSKRPDITNESDIFYRRSTDGGRTWTDAKVINDDDPNQVFFSGLPHLDLAPNGRLDAVWFDTRDDPGLTVNDVYYSFSTDNGETWSRNERITDRSINRQIGPFAGNFDLNGPPGLSSTNAYALMGWDDTRFGDGLTDTQDIFTAAVQFERIGTPNRAAAYILPGVIGLLAVGLLLLAAALVARSRQGPAGTPTGTGAASPRAATRSST
ncbi:MAG: glycoside hydrolase [Actinomycetota bacterium]|nr:glycoside hydrolase [Actinomycetota bacterium]